MNKLFFSILTLISLGVVAQDNTMVNDANAQKRTLTAGFTGIKVSEIFTLIRVMMNRLR